MLHLTLARRLPPTPPSFVPLVEVRKKRNWQARGGEGRGGMSLDMTSVNLSSSFLVGRVHAVLPHLYHKPFLLLLQSLSLALLLLPSHRCLLTACFCTAGTGLHCTTKPYSVLLPEVLRSCLCDSQRGTASPAIPATPDARRAHLPHSRWPRGRLRTVPFGCENWLIELQRE